MIGMEKQQRVLVTGSSGFIGRHLVRNQLLAGKRVRALDCRPQGPLGAGRWEHLETLVGDVGDVAVQRAALAGVDVVFHLASAHLDTRLSSAEYNRVNVEAVASLLEESRRAGVQRLVHVSTCGVHGSVPGGTANEEAPFRPDNIYAQTKAAGEQVVRAFFENCGFSVVVVRPTWVYGPGCQRTARLFRSVANRSFVMIGSGTNVRSATYITDLLDGLDLCATRQQIDGETFILTNDEVVRVGQIVDEIAQLVGVRQRRLRIPAWVGWSAATLIEFSARAVGRRPPITRRTLKFFNNEAGFTSAKARMMLGFKPRISLRDGLELTYQWWRKNGCVN